MGPPGAVPPPSSALASPAARPGYVTLYLDESGGKSWPRPWARNPDIHYVLAGLALDPTQDLEVHKSLPRLLRAAFAGKAGTPPEFHYGDLINGRDLYALLTREERKALADKVFELLLRVRPVLLGTVVRKDWLKLKYGDRAVSPPEYAMNATAERFDRHLGETNQIGMLIMDTCGLADDKVVREIVHSSRSAGTRWVGATYKPRYNSSLDRVLNAITFSPSHMSPGVQLADAVAYATFSKFERNKGDRYNQLDPLWRRVGWFREPSRVPRSPA